MKLNDVFDDDQIVALVRLESSHASDGRGMLSMAQFVLH